MVQNQSGNSNGHGQSSWEAAMNEVSDHPHTGEGHEKVPMHSVLTHMLLVVQQLHCEYATHSERQHYETVGGYGGEAM